MANAVLLIDAPDRPGLVAAVSSWIGARHGNIEHLEQHVELGSDTFFMRVEWALDGFDLARDDIAATFDAEVGAPHAMNARLRFTDVRSRVAIFVSRRAHCLTDLLARVESGELDIDVPVVVSNHDHLAELAHRHRVNFEHVPVRADSKLGAERAQRAILERYDIDLVVLARYMQVLSADFIDVWRERIINIHHSFLPAFPGARPYHRAHERGVKIVGATSHYVTADLDAGPIISQGVVEVSHRDDPDDLVRKGRDVERLVLARAVRAHAEHRILVHHGRTVVFGS